MPKQRAIRIEPKRQIAALQALESKSNEELEAETRFRANAQAILGARAAEKYDAKKSREHFQKALTAARNPQERTQIRRMMTVSLAMAERRADDLKAATDRLGIEGLSPWQLRGFKLMGLVAPPSSAGTFARIRGILIVLVVIIAVLALAFGIVEGIGQIAGGISLDLAIFYSLALIFVLLVGLFFWSRRRQKAALAKRADALAARTPGR
jgi:hypothetical protein